MLMKRRPYPLTVCRWLGAPLVSERVLLRAWAMGDEQAIEALKMDPEVRRYLGGPQSAEKARSGTAQQIAAQHWGHFVVVLRDGDAVVGTVSLDCKRGPWEISLQLRRDQWGRGLMTEAVTTAVAWFYDTASEGGDLIAVTQADNVRTRALLLRCGAFQQLAFTEHGAEQAQYLIPRPEDQG